jgi:hypothetical protein
VTEVWRKLLNEELHNLYSSPNIIRTLKSRRTKWTRHVARVGRMGMHICIGGKARRKDTTRKTKT